MRRQKRHPNWRSTAFGQLLDSSWTITRQSDRFKQKWTRRGQQATNPCPSAKGSEQAITRSSCTKETSKLPESVWKRQRETSWLPGRAWHRAKVENVEEALQERRTQLEHLHRQAAAEASHGAEGTQMEVMFPAGITKHLHLEAQDSLKGWRSMGGTDDNIGLTCSPLRYKRCRTRIVASIEEHVQTVPFFSEPIAANFVHAS